jgi:uncharacterized membrane protein YebE (DUF533 family)
MSYEEKKNCLSLLSCIAKADGHVHEKEREIIAGYSFMMGLDAKNIEEKKLDLLVDYFSKKSETIKKAVFLESLGLVLSDKVFHPAEKSIIQEMQHAFGFTPEFQTQCTTWIQKILPVYSEGFDLVGIK